MKCNSRRRMLAYGLAGTVLASRPVSADILLPGSKFVSHKIKFDNLKEFEKQYKFYFLPLHDDEGPEWAKAQAEFGKTGDVSASGINPRSIAESDGLYLIAVPLELVNRDGGITVHELLKPPKGVLKSERLVSQIRAVQKSDKDEFWTIYHVKIVDGKLQTGLIRHDEPMKRDKVKSNSFATGGFAVISALVAAGTLAARLRQRSGL